MISVEHIVGFLTLLGLEIVLGIDNIVFVSIIAERVSQDQRQRARQVGLGLALLFRIGLLLTLSWITRLTVPLFTIASHEFSGRDIVLFVGGLFLLAKATREIHHRTEGLDVLEIHSRATASFGSVIVQIILIDLVFSLDSVVTAVGLSQSLAVMISANVVAMIVMVIGSGVIASFLQRHPSLVMLALAFLLLVGFLLVLDGVGFEISRGYVYTAMAFSLSVELLNIRRQNKLRRHLRHPTGMQESAS